MKKKLLVICLFVCAAFAMTACGNDKLNDATAPEASATPQGAATSQPTATDNPAATDDNTGNDLSLIHI